MIKEAEERYKAENMTQVSCSNLFFLHYKDFSVHL